MRGQASSGEDEMSQSQSESPFLPQAGATPVQPPYHAVDNIDAVDKITPRFVTR